MTKISDILQDFTVSTTIGAKYTNLNDAIADIDSIKTFRIESATTISTNISIPSGVTLIFGTNGSISGAYTLTGSNTVVIFEGDNSAIATNVIFAGTWICKSVSVENFGAVADGETDDYLAILNAISFCKLTSSKELQLRQKTYICNQVVNVSGLTIYGNNAKIISASGVLFTASGTIGTYYNISGNAYKGDSWIKCSDATLLASLSSGDLLKIISNEIIQPLSNENTKAGEIHEVREVDAENGYVYFNDYLFYTYLTSDTARVAKITHSSLSIYNLALIVLSETVASHIAIIVSGIKNLVLDNVYAKGFYESISINDCYAPLLRVKTFQSTQTGVGYGVQIAGATMYANIEGTFVGARHCITTGNGGLGTGSDIGGISWETKVNNSIGFAGLSSCTVFDTHASTGSIYFNNCTAVGGVFRDQIALITDWDSEVTYAENALVRSSLYVLYQALQENTDKNPDTDINGNWQENFGHSSQAGFKAESLNVFYSNCKVYGCSAGVNAIATAGLNVQIKNLEIYNTNAGVVTSTTSYYKKLDIDGLICVSNSAGVAIYPLGRIDEWSFNNISCKNMLVFGAPVNTAIFPSKLVINNFKAIFDSAKTSVNYAVSLFGLVDDVILNNGETINCNLLKTTLFAEGSNTDVFINNVVCEATNSEVVKIEHTASKVIISGLWVKNPSVANKRFVYFNVSTDELSISNSLYVGTNATKLIATYSSETLTYILHNNNIFPDMTTFVEGTGAVAAIEIVGGGTNSARVYRGTGSPENVIAAAIGTMYLRSDGGDNTSFYIKESGSGNTGWVAK